MNNKRLTNKQKKLLEDNIIEIRKNITKYLRYSKYFPTYNTELIDEVLGFSLDAVKEYDKNKSNQDFSKFIARRCVWRMIDHMRTISDHSKLFIQRKQKVRRIKDEIQKRKGYCEQTDLYEEIKKYDKKRADKILKSGVFKTVHAHGIKWQIGNKKIPLAELLADKSVPEKDIATDDLIRYIIEKCNREFPEDGDKNYSPGSDNISNMMHKILIKEYIIPKAMGVGHKTLKDLASDIGLSESRMSQILNGEKMSKFFKGLDLL